MMKIFEILLYELTRPDCSFACEYKSCYHTNQILEFIQSMFFFLSTT